MHKEVAHRLTTLANKEKAQFLQGFFKTGYGQYAEGDQFLGITVPEQRKIAKEFYTQLTLEDIAQLLQTTIHEYRLTALIMLTHQYEKAKSKNERKALVEFYLKHKSFVNNWDLVDTSTHKILGKYVHETNHFQLLFDLAQEENMWSKRIAVVAFWFLWKKGHISEGLEIIKMNLTHPHDLMHKANGWMLRELGKLDELTMLKFVQENYHEMPRTTLRYAIERLNPAIRPNYLLGRF